MSSDLAGTAAAIEAGVALVRVEAQDRLVADVVGVKAELCRDAFDDRKVLREREVAREAARTGKGIESGVAKRAASRKSGRAGGRLRERAAAGSDLCCGEVVGDRRERNELVPLTVD